MSLRKNVIIKFNRSKYLPLPGAIGVVGQVTQSQHLRSSWPSQGDRKTHNGNETWDPSCPQGFHDIPGPAATVTLGFLAQVSPAGAGQSL